MSNLWVNEALNSLGANRCNSSSQCDGHRTCSAFNYCMGNSGTCVKPNSSVSFGGSVIGIVRQPIARVTITPKPSTTSTSS